MTDAPRKCLSFLIGSHCETYSRKRMCKATGLSPRTADSALRLLVEIGAIEKQHGGRCTPCKIKVLIGLEEYSARYVRVARYTTKIARYVGPVCALSGVLNLKELKKEKAGCFPQEDENKTPEERLRAQAIRNLDPTADRIDILAEMERLEEAGFLLDRKPPETEHESAMAAAGGS